MITSKQNKNRADYCCAAYVAAQEAQKIVTDVYGGTLPMREARRDYVPQNPAELDPDYNTRLKSSVLLPVFKRVITLALGLICHKDPTTKDVEDDVVEHLKNTDLNGTPLPVFARKVARNALRDGHAFIYVDMPPAPQQSEVTMASEPTAADEQSMRPFWVSYAKSQAINWYCENVNGQEVLMQITFRECVYERDGDFGEKEVLQYRVFNPGRVRLYRSARKNSIPEKVAEYETGLDYIPLFPIYGGEEEEALVSDPPLLDLALLNVLHLQQTSDLNNILHVANVPVMWARNRNTKQPFQPIGSTILIDLEGEHSALGFAEHQGNAIGKAQEEIDRTEKRMNAAGFELFAETNGPNTATGEIIDSAKSDSQLSLAVKSLEAGLSGALRTHQQLMGRKNAKGSIELHVQYDRLVLSTEEMRVLKEYAMEHLLSVETVLELLKRAGKLGADFDIKQELERLFGKELADSSAIEREAASDPTRQETPTDQPADPNKQPEQQAA